MNRKRLYMRLAKLEESRSEFLTSIDQEIDELRRELGIAVFDQDKPSNAAKRWATGRDPVTVKRNADILARYAQGGISQRELAKELNCSPMNINRILKRGRP
jgi:transcriptional regulator with XRE-family HTH domain